MPGFCVSYAIKPSIHSTLESYARVLMASGGTAYAECKVHASVTDIQNDTIVVQDVYSNIARTYAVEDAQQWNRHVVRAVDDVEIFGIYYVLTCLFYGKFIK